jgi:diguanylate cyclase (GGDEF)-like protein
LLTIAWEALNVARESKALVLGKQGKIIRLNDLAVELCCQDFAVLEGRAVSELFESHPPHTSRWETNLITRAGDPVAVEITRQSLQGRLRDVEVYALRDLRARRAAAAHDAQQSQRIAQQEQDLRSQNAVLDAALSHMVQGLAMFDADQRLIIANARFAEMYGQTLDDVKPGTPLKEIIAHRIASGLYVGTTVDEVLARMRERVARQRVSHMTSQMGDGRTIAVSIMPRPDGGWVTTHQDITEREKLAARLEEQNDLLRRREKELASQNARFETALNQMSQGFCLFDANQCVVVANRRYAEIYGLRPEQVKPATSLQEILSARLATGLYDNADGEVFVREGVRSFGERASQVMRLTDGRAISVVRVPMPDGGLVSTHEDITERERLHAQLAEQHLQLDAALENMLQGVAMFDAGLRLIVCNKRYAEMYGLSADQVRPGTTVRQIFEYRLASGQYHVKDSEAFVAGWIDQFGEISSRIQELADGRIISVTRRSLGNGGRLITHEDITERQRLTARLAEQHRLLELQDEKLRQQHQQLDAALENMGQGLAMFDAEQRLVVCNRRYAELYGLDPALVKPGTTLAQLLKYRHAAGAFGDIDFEAFSADWLAGFAQASTRVVDLADGRTLSIVRRPMGNGGLVSTTEDITERRRSEAKITHMALHDALTGLPNRVLLNERLDRALANARRGDMVATHMLDLDHFKHVNDTLGHAAGDTLLKLAAARLRRVVRHIDTVARMGGDEFAVIQVGISQPADATTLAYRIIETLSEPYEIDGQQAVIGTSVGISVAPNDGDSPDQILRNADLALYRAKEDGRGSFRFFERDMDTHMQARRAMELDLRKALERGEFELHYQPVLDLATDQIVSCEALLRWRHPQLGMVGPDSFISLAEEVGLIASIGSWVLREACATAARWPDDTRVSVNLSPAQFRNPGLLLSITNALASSGLTPERLELEITEAILLQDSESTLETLYRLRELGIRVAMDDFGTGYSSLSYLQSFPFDKIKIDRSFVRDIVESTGSLNIVRAVAALAKGLGMASTAEGVETQAQLDAVRSEGYAEMQGFWFSKPLPATAIERLLAEPRATRKSAITRRGTG